MYNEETAPAVDKILHADGSVTTMAGEVILPADQNRAEEYQNRAAIADKWLHPDGSVTNALGLVILEADASRAQDYASRLAGVAAFFPQGGEPSSTGEPSVGDKLPTGATDITDSTTTYLLPYAHGKEILPNVFAFEESENTFLLLRAQMHPAQEFIESNQPMNDTAVAILEQGGA